MKRSDYCPEAYGKSFFVVSMKKGMVSTKIKYIISPLHGPKSGDNSRTFIAVSLKSARERQ